MSRVQASEPVGVWRLGAALGEGPVWVERDRVLWFVDIKGQAIHRYDPASDERKSWSAPGQCGFVLPVEGGGFVAGLQQGLHLFDERDGGFSPIVDPEPDRPGNRLNDATVDPQGRLWFGTMDDGESAASGAIYRLGADGKAKRVSPYVAITNGPAVSADGRTLYHVDTLGGIIYRCTIAEDGSLVDRETFVTIANEEGYPDGPCVDAEGCVWIGLYAGWSARRYSPRGELLETVRFPVGNITKLAFGGPDLRTAFATTAAKQLSPAELAKQPRAGDLFSFEVDVPGVPGTMVRVGLG